MNMSRWILSVDAPGTQHLAVDFEVAAETRPAAIAPDSIKRW